MITALLVDDEPSAIARLTEMLAETVDVEVIGTARDVTEAELFIRVRVPDVIFLDVTMPGRLGVDLLPSVAPPTRVIFVTANEAFAVAAFDHGAVDFLLKPFSRERLDTALGRLRAAVAPAANPAGAADVGEAAGARAEAAAAAGGRIVISSDRGRTQERVGLEDILWVAARENHSRIQLRGREPLIVSRPLGEWISILPEPPFHRLDRSLVVQVGLVVRTQRVSRDQTLLFFDGGTDPLPLGRTASSRLHELIDAAGAGRQ
ncbi:MAG: DNA-binding response regulator [Planctomycetia bacterium]|nr:DNA-binding response regulator [Planctomycetia bacterium]